MRTLHDRDLVEWAATNADLLRNRQFELADIENIAAEIEDLGKSLRSSVASHLRNLIAHLLKWQFQPEQRSRSWQRTTLNSRNDIDQILDESPSLKARLPEILNKVYPKAVKLASLETGIEASRFPAMCPYPIEQLLDDDFLPQP